MSVARLNLIVILVLAAAFVASLAAGKVWLSPAELIGGALQPGAQMADIILFDLRLPRTVLAVLVGAALGFSGAALQGLLRNPLAEPSLLGISGGAALGAVIAIYFGLSTAFAYATPALGLLGALAAGATTLAIGRSGGTLALILGGAAVASLTASGVALALNFAPNPYATFEITIWLLGSLADKGWDHVFLCAPFVIFGGVIIGLCGRSLDALALGEAQAQSLGVNVRRTQTLVLVASAIAVGAATAVTGAIGFVGLVAPHIVRPFVGHQPSRTLWPSALLGAALLLVADIATRIVPTISEIRLGVLTSLIGLPFFFWLIIRLKRTAP